MSKNQEQIVSLVNMLKSIPDVDRIYLFGSSARDTSDQYSDIDITVVTAQPSIVDDTLLSMLRTRRGVDAVYTISCNETNIARTIFLSNEEVFHKIDIGISAAAHLELFPDSKIYYVNNKTNRSVTYAKREIWVENPRTHEYLDILIGSLRYIKHRYRQEDWSAYKSYRGYIDQRALNILGSAEISALHYKKLDNANNKEITDIFFNGDNHSKDMSYYNFILDIVSSRKILPQFSKRIINAWDKYLDGV